MTARRHIVSGGDGPGQDRAGGHAWLATATTVFPRPQLAVHAVRTATGSRRHKIADFHTRVHAELHEPQRFADDTQR